METLERWNWLFFSHSKHPVSFVKTPLVWHKMFFQKKWKAHIRNFDIDLKWHSFKKNVCFLFFLYYLFYNTSPPVTPFLRSRSSVRCQFLRQKSFENDTIDNLASKFWLVVEPPNLKNMRKSKWNPKKSGWKLKKIFELPPPRVSFPPVQTWFSCHGDPCPRCLLFASHPPSSSPRHQVAGAWNTKAFRVTGQSECSSKGVPTMGFLRSCAPTKLPFSKKTKGVPN